MAKAYTSSQFFVDFSKRNGFEYDLFVMTRPDLQYGYFDLSTPLFEPNFLYILKNTDVNSKVFLDQIHVSSKAGAEAWLKAVTSILDEMVNDYSPESFMTYNLLKSKIPIRFLNCDVVYLRMNGEHQTITFTKDLREGRLTKVLRYLVFHLDLE